MCQRSKNIIPGLLRKRNIHEAQLKEYEDLIRKMQIECPAQVSDMQKECSAKLSDMQIQYEGQLREMQMQSQAKMREMQENRGTELENARRHYILTWIFIVILFVIWLAIGSNDDRDVCI